MSWRVKQFFRKWTPVALLVVGAWIGFTHWERGGRANLGSVLTSARVAALRTPVLGSYFKGKRSQSYSSYRGRGRSMAYGRRGRRYGHGGHRARHGRRRY